MVIGEDNSQLNSTTTLLGKSKGRRIRLFRFADFLLDFIFFKIRSFSQVRLSKICSHFGGKCVTLIAACS